MPVARHRAASRLLAAAVVPVLLFISLAAWAFASPVGASPDDNFHLASIWCGSGEREGICEPSGDPATRMVPAPLLEATCYAFAPSESAACWTADQPGMGEATWMNANGLYPPLFYWTMSLFVGPDVQVSVLLMRLANALLAVGLLSATFFALPRRLRPALVISAVVAAVPLGQFVIASTNPSSWAYIAASMIWITLYATTLTTGKRRAVLAGLAVVATVIGAGARADASVFALFAIFLALLLGLRRGSFNRWTIVTAGVIACIAITFYLSSGQSGSLSSGLPSDAPALTRAQQLANLFGVPILWFGAFGASGLGWLDTVMPAAVSVLGLSAAAGAIFIGIRRPSWQRGVAVLLAFAALWAVPFVMLSQSHAVVGEIVQSRYILPLIIILLGVATAGVDAVRDWSGTRSAVIALILAFTTALSLHDNIRRYTFGADANAIDPGANAEWWWRDVPSPGTVWIVGSVAFAAALGLLWWRLSVVEARTTARSDGSGQPSTIDPVPEAIAKSAP